MSCCMFEMAGERIRDLLTPVALSAAKIEPRHVRGTTIERHSVHEVLMYHRAHTLSLLHHALRGRDQDNASGSASGGKQRDAGRRHFVTLVRVERPNQAKVSCGAATELKEKWITGEVMEARLCCTVCFQVGIGKRMSLPLDLQWHV
jgi:hypothetical protein